MVWALQAWLTGAAWAACPGPTRSTDVIRSVEAAELAFVDLDDVRLRMERDRAIQAALCLGEVVNPAHAAALLRLEGVFAFVNGNEAFATDAFRSALTVQPAFQLRTAIAPVGGPLHALYERARATPPAAWPLPATGWSTFVNGTLSAAAPAGLAVLQVVEPDGRLAWSGLVTGPPDVPPWLAQARLQPAPVPVPRPVPVPLPVPAPLPAPVPVPAPLEPAASRSGARLPALVVGAVGLVAAGGSFAGSVVMRGRYEAAPTAARRQATNGLYLGSVGAGIVGGTSLVVAVALPGGKDRTDDDDDFGPVY